MRHFGTPLPPRHFFIIYHSLLKINWNENVWSAYKSCQKGHSRKVVGRARRSWNSEIKGWIWSPLPTWPVFMSLDSYVTATCDTLNAPHNPFWQIWPSHWFWFSRFYMMNGVSWCKVQYFRQIQPFWSDTKKRITVPQICVHHRTELTTVKEGDSGGCVNFACVGDGMPSLGQLALCSCLPCH